MLELVCTSCERRFGVLQEATGESVTCPYCGQKMKTPEPVAMLANAIREPPLQPPARVERHRQPFWTPGRGVGLFLVLVAFVLVVVAFTNEYRTWMSKPASLTNQGRDYVTAAAVCAAIGTLAMFLAGPSRKAKQT